MANAGVAGAHSRSPAPVTPKTRSSIPKRLESTDTLASGQTYDCLFDRRQSSPGPWRSVAARKEREGSPLGFSTPGSTVPFSEVGSNRLSEDPNHPDPDPFAQDAGTQPEPYTDSQDLGGFEEVLSSQKGLEEDGDAHEEHNKIGARCRRHRQVRRRPSDRGTAESGADQATTGE